MDLFAGTGNLGIEALSRGAKYAIFVDKSRECYNIIMENLIHTKLKESASIITSEMHQGLFNKLKEAGKFDVIFLDPPYNKNLIQETLNYIIISDIMKENGIIVAERDVDDILPEEVGGFKLSRNQKYGDTILSFYTKNDEQ